MTWKIRFLVLPGICVFVEQPFTYLSIKSPEHWTPWRLRVNGDDTRRILMLFVVLDYKIRITKTCVSLSAIESFNELKCIKSHIFKLKAFYRPQRSWAKVIFSQASVCPQGGGGLPHPPGSRHPPGSKHPPRSRHPPRTRHPQDQTSPRDKTNTPLPPDHIHPPDQTPIPPGSRLQHTVNEQPVRILLECILVPYVAAMS